MGLQSGNNLIALHGMVEFAEGYNPELDGAFDESDSSISARFSSCCHPVTVGSELANIANLGKYCGHLDQLRGENLHPEAHVGLFQLIGLDTPPWRSSVISDTHSAKFSLSEVSFQSQFPRVKSGNETNHDICQVSRAYYGTSLD